MLIALPFWLWGAVFGLTVGLPHTAPACQEGQQEEKQDEKKEDDKLKFKYIVIYEDRGWNNSGPYIELRIMVMDESEGAAVAQSMKLLMEKFGGQNCGHLKFKEVALKRAEK